MIDLYQSRYLDVVPVRRMHARLKDMKLAEAPRLSAEDLAVFAKRFEQDPRPPAVSKEPVTRSLSRSASGRRRPRPSRLLSCG